MPEQDLEELFCKRESSPLERAILSGLWSHHPNRVRGNKSRPSDFVAAKLDFEDILTFPATMLIDSVVPFGRYNPYEKDQGIPHI
jgi:hypothetical protein